MRNLWRSMRELLLGLAVLFVVNTGAMASYYIPSESMAPNLLVGDHLVVSKFAYGYSNHSVAGVPELFKGRILERPITRGDVAVFHMGEGQQRIAYIKRIIGLPGDLIEMRGGALYINGAAVRRERAEDFVYRAPAGNVVRRAQYRETLPNGRSYMTLDLFRGSRGDTAGPYNVPPGHYFAMGDNRDNSGDSRWPLGDGLGFIPADNFVGRAEVILWSWAGLPGLLRTERTFSSLR
jgi:signal peptidase I